MSYVLNARERAALEKLSNDDKAFVIKGKLVGIGTKTLESLVALGLAETGRSDRYSPLIGWRITDDGWRCMYGKTLAELMAVRGPHYPLKVWQWPLP